MNYLDQLKNRRSGPALTEPTKLPSGGFVSAHGGAFSNHSAIEGVGCIQIGDTPKNSSRSSNEKVTFIEDGWAATNARDSVNEAHMAVSELTKPPSGSFVTSDSDSDSESVRRKEDEAWTWLRRFLQYDTVPVPSVQAAAKSAGLSWLMVRRVAAKRVIEQPVPQNKTEYWKLPKTPQWKPTVRIN